MSDVYSVKRLTGEIRELLESGYREIWVEGEISNLATPASGHRYFSLKEDDAVIRCALFKHSRRHSSAPPADGMQALLRGRISLYEPRGDLQLIVSHLEDAGEGALRREFERLKRQLSAEGLFDERHKKPLPAYPSVIGVISSHSGAALHDVRVTLERRYPLARLVVYPTPVQGADAADGIIRMLALANRRRAETGAADLLILARGGGSLEDLQAFNDERVARAIFASELPVVSAVGHETDFTIADWVADIRAPTPTAAAEVVAPEVAQLRAALHHQTAALRRAMQHALDVQRQNLDYTANRLVHPRHRLQLAQQSHRALTSELTHRINARLSHHRLQIQQQAAELRYHSPQAQLAKNRRHLTATHNRLTTATTTHLTTAHQRTAHLTNALNLISPAHTLERGYAILQNPQQEIIRDPAKTQKGQTLTATVARGRFLCVVDGTVSEESATTRHSRMIEK